MANFLPEAWIDEVRGRNDITDIVSEYLVLKPSGRGFFGLCPFHNEKTPSFHVSPEKQIYHCFGCGAGGNVITFIMEMEKIDFIDAVKLLADRSGMSMPETIESSQFIRTKDLRDKIYSLNKDAAKYFYKNLFSSDGSKAMNYLMSRGLSIGTIKAFGLGYAPKGWDNIKIYLKNKGYDEKVLLESGILVENKGKVYDRFRNRIIYPIIHPRGMIIGFGGRVLDDTMPKYLNSSDSPVFNKSHTLYGLNIVKKQRPIESIIIVEGYMDVISLYQFGFKNAVASLGTSLTQDQAKLLRRYSGEVYIAYDGDTAGQMATMRGLDILRENGCKVKVMQFPKEMDPDETLSKYGSEYFKKLINRSISLVDYKIDNLLKKYDLDTQDGKVAFGTEAARILVKLDNLIERDAHIQRIESLTGLKSRVLYEQIKLIEHRDGVKGLKRNIIGNNRYTNRIERNTILIPSYTRAERHLVCLIVQNEFLAEKIFNRLKPFELEEENNRDVVRIVGKLLENNNEISPANVLNYIQDSDKAKKLVAIFNMEMAYDDIDKYIEDCIKEIERHHWEKQRLAIQNEITEMDQQGINDPDKYRRLLQDLAKLTQLVKKSQT